ncbi:MAG: MarR family transcriptional regulator [Lachnospiraceae bacterium]|nr:MarR family transcriptional regulator [Lachnospiraceae bacterium]
MDGSKQESFDALKLENQLCFPLYACARVVMNTYTPFLKPLGLSYTQYISLLVLWETDGLSVKELGKRLYLDSGTLTPVLKSLEQKGLVSRCRCREDERVLRICLTEAGLALRERALSVPEQLGSRLALKAQEAGTLHRLLWHFLELHA